MKVLLKFLYRLIPFKKWNFLIGRALFPIPEKIWRHLWFKGRFRVKVDANHSFKMQHYGYQIENELFWAGLEKGWEKQSLRVWTALCSNANTVFDIGANTGVYALIAQSIRPQARVHAFEPVERVWEKLQHNANLNKFQMHCVSHAVSDNDGTATIYDPGTEHVLSVTVNKDMSDQGVTTAPITVSTLRMDTYIKEQSIGSLDLMKIDVETHEPEVLNGFGEYLEKFRPAILIEILGDEIGRQVEQRVEGLGYDFYYIDENKGLLPVERITKRADFNYLLCTTEQFKAASLTTAS